MSNDPFSGDTLDHSNKTLQKLLSLLASEIFIREEIQQIVAEAKVPPKRIGWSLTPDLLWASVFNEAHKWDKIDALLTTLRDRDPDLKRRINAILSPSSAVNQAPSQKAPLREERSGGTNERILEKDRPALLDVRFLPLGIEAAAAVCKLSVRLPGQPDGYGTGFLIEPDLVLTAGHVLFDERDWTRTTYVKAEFFFEISHENSRPMITVDGIVESCDHSSTHDVALVRLAKAIDGVRPVKLQAAAVPKANDPAFIVQHPGGKQKQVGLYRNEIKYVDGDILQYLTDTDEGSSGAPVFNKDWEVIGIHTRCDRAIDPDYERTDFRFRNQGVLIKHAVSWLTQIGVLGKGAVKG